MKKIVRLTESDLIRLVKRVIMEGQESFDIVPLTLQNIGTGMVMDGKGRNIFDKAITFGSNEIILNIKENINFEEGETITATITLNPVWMVTGEILKTDKTTGANFDPKTKKLTFSFKIPDDRTFRQSFLPEVVLRCNNIEDGKLTIGVSVPKTTVIPAGGQQVANESYRRRYHR